MTFWDADGFDLACTWTAADSFENYPGMLHGGVAATILDELIGQAIFHSTRHLPVSINCRITWIRPVKIGDAVTAAAKIHAKHDRFYAAGAWLYRSDGRVAAEMRGQYYTPTLKQFRRMAELDSVAARAAEWFAPARASAEETP